MTAVTGALNDDLIKGLGEIEAVELDLFAIPALVVGEDGRPDANKARRHQRRIKKAVEVAQDYDHMTSRLRKALEKVEARSW